MSDTKETYRRIYSILQEHAGSRRVYEDDFIYAFTLMPNGPPTEWRFQGTLGIGGKFWRYDGRYYVTCYPEDKTPEREAVIAKVNALLAEVPYV